MCHRCCGDWAKSLADLFWEASRGSIEVGFASDEAKLSNSLRTTNSPLASTTSTCKLPVVAVNSQATLCSCRMSRNACRRSCMGDVKEIRTDLRAGRLDMWRWVLSVSTGRTKNDTFSSIQTCSTHARTHALVQAEWSLLRVSMEEYGNVRLTRKW